MQKFVQIISKLQNLLVDNIGNNNNIVEIDFDANVKKQYLENLVFIVTAINRNFVSESKNNLFNFNLCADKLLNNSEKYNLKSNLFVKIVVRNIDKYEKLFIQNQAFCNTFENIKLLIYSVFQIAKKILVNFDIFGRKIYIYKFANSIKSNKIVKNIINFSKNYFTIVIEIIYFLGKIIIVNIEYKRTRILIVF